MKVANHPTTMNSKVEQEWRRRLACEGRPRPGLRTPIGALAGLLAWMGASAGTVITENLPAGSAIINIDARQDGAASWTGSYALWYRPFSTRGASALPRYSIPAGTYTFRIINAADAAAKFPALTAAQRDQMFSAWTYNSPWIHDYLVFDAAAETDSSRPQLFDGAPDSVSYTSPQAAYAGAIADGSYNDIRPDPLGRAGTTIVEEYTFAVSTTLIFVVPDNGLGDNQGGVSVLVEPKGNGLAVDWFTLDGGGGSSSDGSLTVSGTIGQPDAGTMTDGTLTVQGGFWPGILSTMPPAPLPPTNFDFVVVYSRLGAPDGSVWLASGDGTLEGQVTTGEWPRLSPDCRWMAFRRGHSSFGLASLYTHNMVSREEALVFRPGDWVIGADWAADNRKLYYDYACQMRGVNRDASGDMQLWAVNCYDDAPVVSPADGRLAFQNVSAGIVLAQPDGTGRITLRNTQPNDVWPAWSKDGQSLVFLRGASFWTIGLDGAGPTNLLAALPGVSAAGSVGSGVDSAAAFTPDGQWIVAPLNFKGEAGLYCVSTDGKGRCFKLVTSAGGGAINWVGGVVSRQTYDARNNQPADLELTLSPASLEGSALEDVPLRLTIRNLGPSEAMNVQIPWRSLLPSQGGLVAGPVPWFIQHRGTNVPAASLPFSDAGDLVFGLLDVGDQLDVTYNLRLATGAPAPGTTLQWGITARSSNSDPASANNSLTVSFHVVSPEPQPCTVLYARAGSERDGQVCQARGPIGSSAEVEDTLLTSGEDPRLSPDGNWMLVRRGNADWSFATVHVRSMLDGSERVVFTPGDWVVGVDWAPDSKSLVYDWGCAIYGRNIDNTGDHVMVSGNCYDDAPAVNARDGRIAFHNINLGLCVVQPDGSGRRTVPNTLATDLYPTWSTDGQWLAFYNGTNLFKIRVDGTGRTNLTSNIVGASALGHGIRFSPDDRHLFAPMALPGGRTNVFRIASDGSGHPLAVASYGGAAPVFVGSVTLSEPPLLQIALTPEGRVRLSWPKTAAGWALERSPDLSPGSWQAVGDAIALVGEEFVVLRTMDRSPDYFRLRR